MITFNRGMTADDIYGTKSTDNSAAELLTEELADAYLQVAAGNREIPATVEKAAKYEYLRAKASSVSIVQEESCLVEWIKNGGEVNAIPEDVQIFSTRNTNRYVPYVL